ncbi:DUF6612 family protein [Baia soyae]|uniref:Lipoprotein n=1 Tax=Baia soyae TaxID=1544746 RepID=A0A4R2RY56_9BACL|nr:DUF6612 family protein [Baia soyae]TCP69578.1 hypothetical protein EDD57_10714 [Baia soyae]
MKTLIRSTSILMLTTTLLIGCQPKEAAKPEKAKDTQATVETKKEELTTDELMAKIEANKKAHTYQLMVKGALSIAGTQVQFEENSIVEEAVNPKIKHQVGTSKTLGSSEKVESYEKDGLTYSYQDKKKTWTKTKSAKKADPFSNMDTSLQSFKSMKEAVSSSHEGNQYKIVFDISKAKNRSALEKELTSSFTQDADSQMRAAFKGIKLKSYTLTFTFDDKTFAQTSLEGSLELSTDSKTKPTSVKATVKQNQFAPFNGTITIPADVVKKAKQVSE